MTIQIRVAMTVLVSAVFYFVLDADAQGGLGALAKSGVKGPIVVVDLVKFKAVGGARYEIYDGIAEAKLKDLGGEVIFRGDCVAIEGVMEQDWDRVTFRKYPSMDAVLAMAGSKEYQGAFPNRLASVAKSFVYAYSGELPALNGGPSQGLHPMNVVAASGSDDTVYMLNLLRFKPDGGREDFFMKYGAASGRHIGKLGGGSVSMLKGLGAVIPMEEVDRLILVQYPSAKVFRDMILSDEYQKILPLRADAIEVGLIWSFKMVEK